MPDRMMLLLLAIAATIPGAQAGDVVSSSVDLLDPVLAAGNGVAETTEHLGIETDVAVEVEGLGIAMNVQTQLDGTGAAPTTPEQGEPAAATLGQRSAELAAPVVASTLLVSLLGWMAFGVEAIRLGLGRVAGALRSGWRTLAGLGIAGALFSRIERSSLLDNPVRARILDTIAQDPGISLSDVTARAGVAWGTAVHHLRRLERHGAIVSLRPLAHRRYFVTDSPGAAQRSAVAVVMHPTARRIACLVSQRPGIDQTGICTALHLNNPAASKHLGQFEAQGLVLSSRTGRNRTYHPTGSLHSALLLVEPASILARASGTLATPLAAGGA